MVGVGTCCEFVVSGQRLNNSKQQEKGKKNSLIHGYIFNLLLRASLVRIGRATVKNEAGWPCSAPMQANDNCLPIVSCYALLLASKAHMQ